MYKEGARQGDRPTRRLWGDESESGISREEERDARAYDISRFQHRRDILFCWSKNVLLSNRYYLVANKKYSSVSAKRPSRDERDCKTSWANRTHFLVCQE